MTLFRITPLVPEVKKEPFDDPDYTYELKYDGFRCVAYLQNGRCTTRTREDKYHNRFRFLEEELPGAFDKRKVTDAIFDGEAVALNVEGRPIFNEMMKFGKEPTYIAFDILFLNGKDLRTLPLIERRKILARVIPK
ncbi:MAG: ligase, partial [Candidatus Adlerbacteria bacterium]|nr:ligase [Candidatus Adlerbacteria bacterium]